MFDRHGARRKKRAVTKSKSTFTRKCWRNDRQAAEKRDIPALKRLPVREEGPRQEGPRGRAHGGQQVRRRRGPVRAPQLAQAREQALQLPTQ